MSAADASAGIAAQAAQAAPPSTLSALGGSLLALIFVIGLILALAWVARRLPGAGIRGHNGLRVVASLAVGMKERIVVVAVGERQLVLGVTSQQITVLQTLDAPLPEQKPVDFGALLSRRTGSTGDGA